METDINFVALFFTGVALFSKMVRNFRIRERSSKNVFKFMFHFDFQMLLYYALYFATNSVPGLTRFIFTNKLFGNMYAGMLHVLLSGIVVSNVLFSYTTRGDVTVSAMNDADNMLTHLGFAYFLAINYLNMQIVGDWYYILINASIIYGVFFLTSWIYYLVAKKSVYSSMNFGKPTGYIWITLMMASHAAIAYGLWAVQKWWWTKIPDWIIYAFMGVLTANYYIAAFFINKVEIEDMPQKVENTALLSHFNHVRDDDL